MQRSLDRDLIRRLEQADRDAQRRINAIRGKRNIGAKVEAAQLREARTAILRVLAELWESVGDITRAGRIRAASAALEMSFDWDQVLLRTAFPSASDRAAMLASLKQTASRNVELAIARMSGRQIALSERIYRAKAFSNDQIGRKIDSALARGLNWRQFANEVRDSIRPDAPGGVSYAAKRLARTEINNAYHAMSAALNADKPWNTGMVWETSKSHPKTDICDLLAERSPYPLDEVPPKPHPNCLCFIYPETVSNEEFLRQFRAGQFDNYLQTNYGAAA